MTVKKLLSFTASLGVIASMTPAYAQYFPTLDSNMNIADLCNDVVGQNSQNDILGMRSGQSWENSSSGRNRSSNESINNRSGGGGGGVTFLGIGARGNGQSASNVEERSSLDNMFSWSNSNRSSNEYQHDRSSTTAVAVGRNCSTVVDQMGRTQQTEIEQQTLRMQIQAGERMHERDLNHGSRQQMFQFMNNW